MTALFPHLSNLTISQILAHYGFETVLTETIGVREIAIDGAIVFCGTADDVLAWLADVVAGVDADPDLQDRIADALALGDWYGAAIEIAGALGTQTDVAALHNLAEQHDQAGYLTPQIRDLRTPIGERMNNLACAAGLGRRL